MITNEERLAEIEAAISAILKGGQEVQTRNGRVKMADLRILQEERANLVRLIDQQKGSSLIDIEFLGG